MTRATTASPRSGPRRAATSDTPNARGVPASTAIGPTAESGWPQQKAIASPTPMGGMRVSNRAVRPSMISLCRILARNRPDERGRPRARLAFVALHPKRHFHRRNRAQRVDFVDVAHVADADHLALELALAIGELDAELALHVLSPLVVVDAGRRVDAGYAVG